MDETRITSAQALVADFIALEQLLDEVPDGGEISLELCNPCFMRSWRYSDEQSFCIASDGTTAVCHTVTGLRFDEMIAPWLILDDYRRWPGFTPSAPSRGNIIDTEQGLTAELDG